MPVPPGRLNSVEFPAIASVNEIGFEAFPMDNVVHLTQAFEEEYYRLIAAVIGWPLLHLFSGILNATAPTLQDIELWLPPLPKDGVDGFAAGKVHEGFSTKGLSHVKLGLVDHRYCNSLV
jgi:hypothetical protein